MPTQDNYRDGGSRSICFSKEDCRKLQVLQNQVLKLLVYGGPVQRQIPLNIPTSELLEKSGDLSVHQLGALQTLTMVKKTVMSQKPSYIAERHQIVHSKMTRSGSTLNLESTKLVQRREGIIYRGGTLFNLIPAVLKNEPKIKKFKKGAKEWVRKNIKIKP